MSLRRKYQETIQHERKSKEWNISLQRQTNLKLNCCLIYYNKRYRSVYWLKYHAAGFSCMCVHIQYALYIKGLKKKNVLVPLDAKPGAEPI